MIRKKRNDKAAVLPVRPSPPALHEIQADIQNAPDDDFVFISAEDFKDVDVNLSIFQNDSNSEGTNTKPDEKSILKVEEQYNKVLKFVKLHKSLIDGQKELLQSSKALAKTCEIVQEERKALQVKLEEQQKLYGNITG